MVFTALTTREQSIYIKWFRATSLAAGILSVAVLAGCAPAQSTSIQDASMQGVSTQGAKRVASSSTTASTTARIATKTKSTPPTKSASQPTETRPLPPLNSVNFVSADTGFVGGQGVIEETTDSGRTWQAVYKGEQSVSQLSAVDAEHVWAVVGNHLLQTRDGGQHWKMVSFPDSTAAVTQVQLISAKEGFALLGGVLYYTSDGGTTWTKRSPDNSLQSFAFADNSTGYALMGNSVVRTTDGGIAWYVVETLPVDTGTTWISRMVASGSAAALEIQTVSTSAVRQPYLVQMTQDMGQSWHTMFAQTAFSQLYPSVDQVTPMDAFAGPMAMPDKSHLWVFGFCPVCHGWGSASVALSDDGGKTFRRGTVSGLTAPTSFSVSFVNDKMGWLATTSADGSGEVLQTTDGGESWVAAWPRHMGPAPGQVTSSSVTAVPASTYQKLPLSIGPVSAWQDGSVRYKGTWEPLYVISGTASGRSRDAYLEVVDQNVASPSYFALYEAPREIGPLKITAISDSGTVLHLQTAAGQAVTFDLQTHSWRLPASSVKNQPLPLMGH